MLWVGGSVISRTMVVSQARYPGRRTQGGHLDELLDAMSLLMLDEILKLHIKRCLYKFGLDARWTVRALMVLHRFSQKASAQCSILANACHCYSISSSHPS